LAEAVAGDTATAEQFGAAREFAAAHLDLTRILCAQVTSKLSIQPMDPQAVRRLCGFDRYERRAWTKRKHAARELDHLREQLR
jgi:hypothetical protein